MTNLFEDQHFTVEQLQQAQTQLLQLLLFELKETERLLLHKLIAVVCFAIDKNEQLFGLAD
jgi:hypothetical protein